MGDILNNCFEVTNLRDFAEFGLMHNMNSRFAGRLKDDGWNTPYATFEGVMNLLVPKEWILEHKDKMVDMMIQSGNNLGALYFAFSGNTAVSHDQSSSLSLAHRTA